MQWGMDSVLLGTYAGMALSLGRPLLFPFFALCLFVLSPLKYMLALPHFNHPVLIRKITNNVLGAILCTAVFSASIVGYTYQSAWVLAVIFVCATAYLLFINPAYRLPDETKS